MTLKADRLDAARPQPAARRARQGLADGPAHAGAVRGAGRRRRRHADLLHRDRGAGGRRRRHRRGAGARPRRSARSLFDAMTPEQRERFLPPFLADDRYHLALADREPDSDSALGINYHRPAAARAPSQDHGGAQRRRLDHQRRQGLRRQCAARQAVRRRRSQTDSGRGACSWCRATRPASRCARTSRAALVSRRLRRGGAARIAACRPTTCSASRAQPAARRRPRRAARAGAQSRHRPRRLRGGARLCAAARAGRPPDHRAPGDRHQARRHRDPARGRAQRDLAGGLGRGPSRGASPTAACRTCRSPPSPRCSPPRRSIAPPRTRPSASAPWA